LDIGLDAAEWFKHSGCIDLTKIAEYINAYDTFQRANSDFSTQHVEWQLTHLRKCTDDRGSCGCPPEPEGPIEPTLEDYKTEKECSISEVLRHPYVERLTSSVREKARSPTCRSLHENSNIWGNRSHPRMMIQVYLKVDKQAIKQSSGRSCHLKYRFLYCDIIKCNSQRILFYLRSNLAVYPRGNDLTNKLADGRPSLIDHSIPTFDSGRRKGCYLGKQAGA